MKRILFVDKDAQVLADLEHTMHGMQHEWEMDFIDNTAEALTSFRHGPYDIVVSEMRMPKMDGADFLEKIKRLAPESIRIILSGHADPALIMKSVGHTHQYLLKPCEPETLKRTIERAYALKQLVCNEALQQLVSGLGELPSIPSAYQEIVASLQSPSASLTDIGRIIGKDVGMTAKILQLVNSAFFGIANPVVSVEQAVSLLGLDTVGNLVLSHGIFAQYDGLDESVFSIETLWRYSGVCAALAKIVARAENFEPKLVDDAFLGGMLHDVGKLVFASQKTKDYAEVLRRVEDQNGFTDDAEREIMGATHGEVGAYLMGLWGLPDSIVEAVAYHEKPSLSNNVEFGVLGIVHVASRLALSIDADPTDSALHVDLDYLQQAGVADRWATWQSACRKNLPEEEHAA